MNSHTTIRKIQPHLHGTWLIMTFAIFLPFTADVAAGPIVTSYAHFTDRFGPNSVPFLPVGNKVQIFALLNSNDPVGSPTISVQAHQGSSTLVLDPIPAGSPLFAGLHGYYKFIDFDPSSSGAWEIIPSDSTGIGPSTLTNAILEPEFLPLVENITLQGTPLGTGVSWTLPNLAGFDVDGIGVRIIEATTGNHIWQSNLLPVQTTSFQAPAGVLQAGVDYVYWINLLDIESFGLENSSKAFSGAFSIAVPEPASVTLLILAAVGVSATALMRRRLAPRMPSTC